MSKIELQSYYIVSALKAGNRVYYDTDYHSGGYPYWSSYANSAKQFDTVDQIPNFKYDDYMYKDVTSLEVLEVVVMATVIETTELVNEAVAKAQAEIAEIQKELAEKIARLEGMK